MPNKNWIPFLIRQSWKVFWETSDMALKKDWTHAYLRASADHELRSDYLWLWCCREKGASSHCRKLFGLWPAPIKMGGRVFLTMCVCVCASPRTKLWLQAFCARCPCSAWKSAVLPWRPSEWNAKAKSDKSRLCRQNNNNNNKNITWTKAGFAFVA